MDQKVLQDLRAARTAPKVEFFSEALENMQWEKFPPAINAAIQYVPGFIDNDHPHVVHFDKLHELEELDWVQRICDIYSNKSIAWHWEQQQITPYMREDANFAPTFWLLIAVDVASNSVDLPPHLVIAYLKLPIAGVQLKIDLG
jgi:hypothetical protein